MWTKLETESYQSNKNTVAGQTIAQGMVQTGGYIGTDLDDTKHGKALAQIQSHIDMKQQTLVENLKR